MVTSRFDALPRDALVEGVHPARRPVGDGGGEEVVGGGVLHPAVELALVLLRDPAVLGHPLDRLGQVLDLEVVPVEGSTLLQPEVGDWLARLRLARLVPARGGNDGNDGNNENDGNDGNDESDKVTRQDKKIMLSRHHHHLILSPVQ